MSSNVKHGSQIFPTLPYRWRNYLETFRTVTKGINYLRCCVIGAYQSRELDGTSALLVVLKLYVSHLSSRPPVVCYENSDVNTDVIL